MYSPCEYACKDGSLLNRHMREVHGHVPLQRPSPIRTRTRSSHASHISPTPSPPPLQPDSPDSEPELAPQDDHNPNSSGDAVAAHGTCTSVAAQPLVPYVPPAAPVLPITLQPHVFSSPVHLDTPQQVSRTTQSVYDSQYKPRMPDGPFTVPRIARHNPSPAFSCGEALQDEISYPASGFCAPYDYNVQTNIATSSYGSMFGQGQYSRLRDESHNDTSMLSMHWQGSALVASSISAPNADIFEAGSSYSYPASNRPFTFDPVQDGYTYAAFTPRESDSYFWAAYQ
jgi:hypothetical protein